MTFKYPECTYRVIPGISPKQIDINFLLVLVRIILQLLALLKNKVNHCDNYREKFQATNNNYGIGREYFKLGK